MEQSEIKEVQKPNMILLIVSYIFWLAVSINNWVAIRWLYSLRYRRIWLVYIYLETEAGEQAPIQMYYIMNYIVFNLTIAIIFIGCIVFFITTTCKKDQGVINGMMGKVSRFHFIPLIFFFAMTVLGELDSKASHHITQFYDISKVGIGIFDWININDNNV